MALSYLKAGFQAFILRYSVGEDAVWPNPLDDYEQAMGLIRERAEEWNLYQDKIAVVGFSAGGHLAAAAAVMGVNRPNAAVLGYAVTGTDVRACCRTAPDTVSAVDGSTPPCFLFSSRTDNVVRLRVISMPMGPMGFPPVTVRFRLWTGRCAAGSPAGWRTASGG